MSSKSGIDERRRDPRIPVMMQVSYTDGEDFMVDYSINLSFNGIFINTLLDFAIGEKVYLKFALPGYKQAMHILGNIRWAKSAQTTQDASALPGIGIEFTQMTDSDRAAVHHFVNRFLPAENETALELFEVEDWQKVHELYQGDQA